MELEPEELVDRAKRDQELPPGPDCTQVSVSDQTPNGLVVKTKTGGCLRHAQRRRNDVTRIRVSDLPPLW